MGSFFAHFHTNFLRPADEGWELAALALTAVVLVVAYRRMTRE